MKNQQIRKNLYLKAAKQHIPLSGSFELTPRCNMNCKMCYIRLSKQEQEKIGRERTAEEWLKLGKTCREAGMLFLLLTGGEPFLREDFRQIYEGLYDLGLMISINTNGTLITEEMITWLQARPPVKVNVTLYGGSEETYASLCGYQNGYHRAVSAISMLKEAEIKVSVNVSFTNENMKDFEKIQSIIQTYKVPARKTSYMFPPVRKGESKEVTNTHRMSPQQASQIMYRCDTCGMSEEAYKKKREKMLSGISEHIDECIHDDKMRCMAGRSAFWVTWNWQMRGCGMMTWPTIAVEPDVFLQVWNQLGEEIDSLRFPQACTECKLRSLCLVCGAVVQAEGQGDMTQKPEYVCEMMREYIKKIQ